MRLNIDGADGLAGFRVQCLELVARCEPDILAVIGDAVNLFDIREGAIFLNYLRFRVGHRHLLFLYFHAMTLVDWQRSRE
jgi:hypothetical protein